LKFEGEYLNDLRNGNGKEYYYGGKFKFEAKYLNNKKLFGKKYPYEYKGETVYMYEGELFNGHKNGKGKECRNDKLIFEGLFLNGFKYVHGK